MAKPLLLWCAALTLFCIQQIYIQDDANILNLPPEPGDGQDYDSIGLNIARERGFGFYWDDPEWRLPYENFNQDKRYFSILERHGPYTATASRPPLFPLLLAGIYKSLGRDFYYWRVVNCICVSLAMGLVIIMAYKFIGVHLAAFTFAWAILDPKNILFSSLYLAESLSLLLLTYCCYILYRLQSKPKEVSSTILLALGCALLVSLKNIFTLYLPFILFIACFNLTEGKFSRLAIKRCFYFCLTLFLLLSPWALRNYKVFNKMLPFGSQMGELLALDYSNQMIDSNGLWTSKDHKLISEQIRSLAQSRKLDPGDELVKSELGREIGQDWIRNNIELLPKLVWLKASSFLWRDIDWYQRTLLMMALFGAWLSRRNLFTRISILIFCASLSSVCLSHNVVNARFMYPCQALLYLMAGWAVYCGWRKVFGRRDRWHPKMSPERAT